MMIADTISTSLYSTSSLALALPTRATRLQTSESESVQDDFFYFLIVGLEMERGHVSTLVIGAPPA